MTPKKIHAASGKDTDGKVDAFEERIKVAIEQAGGATKMAIKAGVSGSALRKWRAGHSEPSRVNLINMARAGGVSVQWLATGEGPKRSMDYQEGSYTEKVDEFTYVTDLRVSEEGVVSSSYAFRTDWLKKKDLENRKLYINRMKDDSMQPTIQPGDLLLLEGYMHKVDSAIKNGLPPGELPPEDGIYQLQMGSKGRTAMRRLKLDMAGGVFIMADSDDKVFLHLTSDKLEQINIIGRVVWTGRSFY